MNAFDKVAKKSDSTATKKSTVKIAAEVDDDIKAAVDVVITNKAEIKRLTAELGEKELEIIEHVRPQQDELGFCGSFTKSMSVQGNNGDLVYSTSDRFSVPQDEPAQEAIKKIVGTKLYAELFSSVRSIAIKAEVLKDEKTLNKIAAACEKAGLGIGEIFDVSDKLTATKGLDEKQFQLKNKKALDQFRTLVKQNKPALKY